PDSIAIIGASADTETLRGRLTHALIGHGYDGRVVPVTRSQNEVLGLRAYPSVAVLPEPVDLAVILVPAAHVVETLEQCGRRGIRAAVVISSGNQTVLEAHDYIDWWLDEGSADIFLLYLEGIRSPDRFRAVADKAADAGKPLIVAKVGRSAAGRRAAASHTGALAQSGDIDD